MIKEDFDPSKVKKVAINQVVFNGYNPKKEDTKEFEKVKDSIRVNGLKSPLFVREGENEEEYILVDGAQRYQAAWDLGYDEIYIYNLGKVDEEEAKALTLWFQTQVSFENNLLAPLVVELAPLEDIELPYDEGQVIEFQKMAGFEFDNTPVEDDFEMRTLKIKMTKDQYEVVHKAIETVSRDENVSEGRALELLVAEALSGMALSTES